MHLTREALDIWAADVRRPESRTRLLVLADGDSMDRAPGIYVDKHIVGPAVVELVVYRDGGWSTREMVTETPESIALAASLVRLNNPDNTPRRDSI